MKICLVCSYGGHLAEMLNVMEAVRGHDLFLLTHREKYLMDTGVSRVYQIPRLIPDHEARLMCKVIAMLNMAVAALSGLVVFLKERPEVVLSTGAEIAIPICYLAKLFRRKVIYIESVCRVNEPSVTGKVVYPIADLFLVQWERLRRGLPKARFEGRVL